MSPETAIAQLAGVLFLVTGAALMIHPDHYRKMARRFIEDPALYYLSGVLALLAGAAILIAHHDWPRDWRAAITLLGYLSLAKGTARLLLPVTGPKLAKDLIRTRGILVAAGLAITIAGGWLVVVSLNNGG